MTRLTIQVVSDLHLEAQPSFSVRAAPTADVLVLAGDIGSYQPGSQLSKENRDFGLTRFSLHGGATGWSDVLFVPGNHEYDGGDFDELDAELRNVALKLGILLLERSTVVLRGVRFVGTTLWSDFDALAVLRPDSTVTEELKQRSKAFRAANYYLSKMLTTRHGRPFLAEQLREQALICQAWLHDVLATHFDGPTVVITHFAPSLRSADPRYGLTPGTAGFCNSLDNLLPMADLWIHGHLHAPSDYAVLAPNRAAGLCRVICNPLGYAAKGEQERFNPTFTVDI